MSRIKGAMSIISRRRIKSIFFICILLYFFLIYRLSNISIFKGEEYSQRVENQCTEKISLNSGRGIIYDRNNIPLTDNEEETVLLVPSKLLSGDYDNIILLKKATNLKDEDIYKSVQKQLLSNIVEIEVNQFNENMRDELEEKGGFVVNNV